ncbi:hypothetical protein K431DRAFT_288642 [Polychaeton citri CBS 116435]|uniref:RING-type domain-containing protein n=1 Tax=Polychaeton citri CBS 116435 TaxID=1314669 RepID=A0A9P4UIX7_9PEZI|nr:hypothetical protein K431DRAFT_288642 [Polychaeton citri CBS 116435]
MEQTCIVCLGDLRTSLDQSPPPEAAAASVGHGVGAGDDNDGDAKTKLRNTRLSSKRVEADDEIIAHLLPCKHDLHNECLKPWVERANSCPICRAKFNMVELSKVVGGPVIDTYAVQDKVQEADIDPSMIVDDEDLTSAVDPEPCTMCGAVGDAHDIMYCDGCDKTIHVFCAGYDDAPEVWYCESCLRDMENDVTVPGYSNAMPGQRRIAAGSRARSVRRNQRSDRVWNRIWQEVSRRLDMDLDFPFPEEELLDTRTDEQRAEFENWQRRLEIASRQGAAERLRGIAQARMNAERAARPDPESQEELRAWNAFDKARELEEAPEAIRQKRRRTASPDQPDEPEPQEARQQKRPRLRRPPQPPSNAPESSTAAAQRAGDGPTFLSSLLREVETKPVSAASPDASEQANGPLSPGSSSPVQSPASSAAGTPRPLSPTPPPQRPISPPLSSYVVPMSPTFSPFSPTDVTHNRRRRKARKSSPAVDGDGHQTEDEDSKNRAAPSSPTGNLSYSAKQEVQRMVKLALGPRYRDKEISKDQYTDINRDVSRKMYDLVGDATALSDHAQRQKWQDHAEAEVRNAIASLHFGPES